MADSVGQTGSVHLLGSRKGLPAALGFKAKEVCL